MSGFTPGKPGRAWRTVVGVVSDVRYRGLDEVQLDVYDPAMQVGRPADNVVVRTSGDPLALAGSIRSLARARDATATIDEVTTMQAVVSRAEAPWRLTMWMFVLFAALAFGLAALGLFSLVALDVTHRGREFAIRFALGAPRTAILRGVLMRAAWRVSIGLVVGLVASVAASRAMNALLFGIAPTDGLTYAGVLFIVLLAVGLAAYVPARRAGRVDPHALLRQG
jgi:predicted lysophospholipase L1 biosynthesis ABC-type transport system permease subunit